MNHSRQRARATTFLRAFALVAACSVGGLAACGDDGNDDHEDESLATLSIEPPTTELLIINGVEPHQTYTATLTFPDGFTKDVTALTEFTVDAAYGTFTGNDLAMGTAGKTSANGIYASKTATAQVIARVKSTRVDPGLPANTPDLFTGAETTARAPVVVYPAAGVIIPRNLGDFEIHWTDGSGNDVFEVSLKTEFSDVRVYVPGGNGMPAAGVKPSYQSFQATEWIAAVGVEANLQYQVRGIQRSNPAAGVGAGPARDVKLSNEPMLGGLYYWASTSTGGGTEGIYRHDMSKPGLPAEEYMTRNQTIGQGFPTGRCVGCHVLSRDGTRMAIKYDGGGGFNTLLDVATRVPQSATFRWNFGTFTPDASQFLSVQDGVLVVRTTVDQSVVATMPSTSLATHPDLSPDGTKLVYVLPVTNAFDYCFGLGRIVVRSYNAATRTFGAEQIIVADGVFNNYYPTWSPDGQWILFNRSTNNTTTGCAAPGPAPDIGGAFSNATAQLWVVKADGTTPPIQLTAANSTVGQRNSWGKWAPFGQTLGTTQEPMFWITVSSVRNFGVRLFNEDRPQIWMTPFFPNRATAAQDPSAPAFRLPFQNIGSSNHIAQWTERVVLLQ